MTTRSTDQSPSVPSGSASAPATPPAPAPAATSDAAPAPAVDYTNQIPDAAAAAAQVQVFKWTSGVVVKDAVDWGGVSIPSVSLTLRNVGKDTFGLMVNVDFLNTADKSVYYMADYIVASLPAGYSTNIEIDATNGTSDFADLSFRSSWMENVG